MARYEYKPFPYRTPPELSGGVGRRWPVVIVGVGPIGLAAAIDLALHVIACAVMDDNDVESRGRSAGRSAHWRYSTVWASANAW